MESFLSIGFFASSEQGPLTDALRAPHGRQLLTGGEKKGAQPLRVVGRQKRVFCARVPGGKPARADHIFG